MTIKMKPTILKSSPASDDAHSLQELLIVVPDINQHDDGGDYYLDFTWAYRWGQHEAASQLGFRVQEWRCRSQRWAPGSPCAPPRVSPSLDISFVWRWSLIIIMVTFTFISFVDIISLGPDMSYSPTSTKREARNLEMIFIPSSH